MRLASSEHSLVDVHHHSSVHQTGEHLSDLPVVAHRQVLCVKERRLDGRDMRQRASGTRLLIAYVLLCPPALPPRHGRYTAPNTYCTSASRTCAASGAIDRPLSADT